MSLKDKWNALTSGGQAIAIITVVGGFLTILTQITPAVSAWDDFGFPTIASRKWVREDNGQIKEIVERLTGKQNDMQLDTLNGKIEAATSSRNSLEIAALKYDEEGKIKAQQEMRRLDVTIFAYNEQKQAIQNRRGPR